MLRDIGTKGPDAVSAAHPKFFLKRKQKKRIQISCLLGTGAGTAISPVPNSADLESTRYPLWTLFSRLILTPIRSSKIFGSLKSSGPRPDLSIGEQRATL